MALDVLHELATNGYGLLRRRAPRRVYDRRRAICVRDWWAGGAWLGCAALVACAARLRTTSGVGKLNALALKAMYHCGEFSKVDRFIAFLGLDIKVRDSGTY